MPAKEILKKFRAGTLHSGKGGPIVTNPHQARAIELSYARKEGADIPEPPKRTKPKRKGQ
jgi:hypothetical protein